MNSHNITRQILLAVVLTIFICARLRTQRVSEDNPVVSRVFYPKVQIGASNPATIQQYLLSNFGHLRKEGITLRTVHDIKSLGSSHITFSQFYNGVKVFFSQIKVNVSKDGVILSVFDNTRDINFPLPTDFPDEEALQTYLLRHQLPPRQFIQEKVYYPAPNETWIPALNLRIFISTEKNYEVLLDYRGNEVFFRDMNVYFTPPAAIDSVVHSRVFITDPVTSAGVSYGTPYVDSNDIDLAVLTNELKWSAMKVLFDNGIFRLESPYIKITEHSIPVTTPAISTTDTFSFTRSAVEFEDVNAFFHLSAFHQHLRALDSQLVNFLIHIDAHGMNGADNSAFTSTSTPLRISYGEGNVDDAEDADVIIHEYAHALSYRAAPGTNAGGEREALDEGISDYFASSYSKRLNLFNWFNVFPWDGHNPFWSGRISNSQKKYPQDLGNGIYLDGEIWSSVLMEIWDDIGGDTADAILLESMYSYASNMKMSDAAGLYLQADTLLYGGSHYGAICSRFKSRGLVSQCMQSMEELPVLKNISIRNSAGFGAGEDVVIGFEKETGGTLTLYTATGVKVLEKKTGRMKQCMVNSKGLSRGIYLLSIRTPGESASIKLINN